MLTLVLDFFKPLYFFYLSVCVCYCLIGQKYSSRPVCMRSKQTPWLCLLMALKNICMCEAQIAVICQNGGSDAAVPDRLLLRWKPAWADAVPCTTEDHQLLKKVWVHTSRLSISTNDEEETGKSQMGWGRRFTDICYNRSKLFTWNCRSRCQVVSSQFWVFEGTHTTLLLKRGFPHSKNKHVTSR